jgi:hypothetical protein
MIASHAHDRADWISILDTCTGASHHMVRSKEDFASLIFFVLPIHLELASNYKWRDNACHKRWRCKRIGLHK